VSDDLIVFPDWLAGLSQWLRDQPELVELLDGRVVTELPAAPKTFPLLVVNQITDPVITGGAHWAVRALFQLDAWGGPKSLTWTIAETARALITQRFVGRQWTLPAGVIVAGHVTAGGIRRHTDNVITSAVEADAEVQRARPKASFDVGIVLHPGRSTGS